MNFTFTMNSKFVTFTEIFSLCAFPVSLQWDGLFQGES